MAEPVVEVRGATELALKLNDIGIALARNSKLMGRIGARVNTFIKERTAEGKSTSGAPFDPYTPRYAAWRKKEGYPTEHVDLTLTGSMFAALTYTAENDRVTSFFMDTADKRTTVRNPAKAFFNQERRDFFSMSADEVKDIEAMVNEYIDDQLRSDKRGTK